MSTVGISSSMAHWPWNSNGNETPSKNTIRERWHTLHTQTHTYTLRWPCACTCARRRRRGRYILENKKKYKHVFVSFGVRNEYFIEMSEKNKDERKRRWNSEKKRWDRTDGGQPSKATSKDSPLVLVYFRTTQVGDRVGLVVTRSESRMYF